MKRTRDRPDPRSLAKAVVFLVVGLLGAFSGANDEAAAQPRTGRDQIERGSEVKWIDTHAHLGAPGTKRPDAPVDLEKVISVFDRWGVAKALIMPPPSPAELTGLERQLLRIVKSRPERFALLGGNLQPLIQKAIASGAVSSELRARLEAKAREWVQLGAVGFGEMTALHFSFADFHPYVEAPPNHPLFLLLAELAAKHDVPIDLHIEAVLKEMPTPAKFLQMSPHNPPTVQENISAFEQLLSHNRTARIVWAHVGWDNTGDMTVDLLRRLLQGHPNLYLQIRVPTRQGLFPHHNPLDDRGNLRPEWMDLIQAFPERFVLGSDTFMARPDFNEGVKRTGSLLRQLPPNLARKVGYENATRIYRLE